MCTQNWHWTEIKGKITYFIYSYILVFLYFFTNKALDDYFLYFHY